MFMTSEFLAKFLASAMTSAIVSLWSNFTNVVVTAFFNDPTVQQSLGAKQTEWDSCDTTVYMDLLDDWMVDMATVVPDLLEGGIPVLVYSGDQDYVCNYLGGKGWTA